VLKKLRGRDKKPRDSDSRKKLDSTNYRRKLDLSKRDLREKELNVRDMRNKRDKD
jgi:hypothetical protein